MWFCPDCANILLLKPDESGEQSMSCPTCPYVHRFHEPKRHRVYYKAKQMEDILGGKAAWDNVDQTDAVCAKCENARAYFMMIQTRSADEPSTVFYKCTNYECGHQWKEN